MFKLQQSRFSENLEVTRMFSLQLLVPRLQMVMNSRNSGEERWSQLLSSFDTLLCLPQYPKAYWIRRTSSQRSYEDQRMVESRSLFPFVLTVAVWQIWSWSRRLWKSPLCVQPCSWPSPPCCCMLGFLFFEDILAELNSLRDQGEMRHPYLLQPSPSRPSGKPTLNLKRVREWLTMLVTFGIAPSRFYPVKTDYGTDDWYYNNRCA